jgi:membrane protease YdiL (CAAX protease family)
VALLLLVPVPSIGTAAAMVLAPGPPGQAIYAVCKGWLLALPLLWLLLVDRGRLSWSPPRQGGLVVGFVLGVLVAAIIGTAYFAAGGRLIDATQVRRAAEAKGLASPLLYLGMAAYLVLVNSLLEEYVWRWFVFRKCETIMPGGLAVFASALFFTIHHVIALRALFDWEITILGAVGVMSGAAIWSWCYRRYRSIWPGYISHAIVDIAVLAIGWRLIFG